MVVDSQQSCSSFPWPGSDLAKCLSRLYREWEELRAGVMGERGRQVSAEEGALLRAKGLTALHALLQVVTERVLDFIAAGPAPGQVTYPAHASASRITLPNC